MNRSPLTAPSKGRHTTLLLPQPNQLTLIVPNREHQVQASIHQRPPTQRAIVNITGIPRARLQSLDSKRRHGRLDRSPLLESEDEGFVFLLADELHGGPVGVVGQAEAVEVTGDDDGVDFGPVGEDTGNGGRFFGGEVGGFEFEAEGAALFFFC